MGVERLVAVESAKLAMREPIKYGGLVAGMYALSLKNGELGRVARTSYFFLRHIDDYLDEGKEKSNGRLPYVLDLRGQIASGRFEREPKIAELAKYSLEVLERKASSKDNPRQDFLTVIDAMVFDYERSKERRILSSEELNDYYHDVFFSVVNIALIGFESRFRAHDIPALSYCQGRVYALRDLEEDWQRGVINIPKETLEQADLTQHSQVGEIRANPIVKDWIRDQLSQSKTELIDLKTQLQVSGEQLTPRLCNGVTKTALQMLRKYDSARVDAHTPQIDKHTHG